MSRRFKGWVSFCFAISLVAGTLPAEASEVVKLARLVVSGKRTANEAPRSAPQETRRSTNSQANGSGGNNDAGTAPTPVRGIS